MCKYNSEAKSLANEKATGSELIPYLACIFLTTQQTHNPILTSVHL